MIEQLLKILNKRKNEININGSELDKKKIQNIEQFLNVPNCFFQVDEDEYCFIVCCQNKSTVLCYFTKDILESQ